jgi:hypothetical protein
MQKLDGEWLTSEATFSIARSQVMDPLTIGPEWSGEDRKRLTFSQIEGIFKCPVAGWCLDLAEQKEVLRKEGISVKGKSDLEIHELLVKSLEDENSLSRRVEFWLNRKYRKEIEQLSSLEPEEFIKHWKASLSRDEIEGLLWVAVTKGDLSAEARKGMFGDLHMETHQRAKELGSERQRLRQERKTNETLAESAKELSQINRTLKKENEKASNELAVANRLSSALQKQLLEIRRELSQENKVSLMATLREENAQLRTEKDSALMQITVLEREVRGLENQNNKLLTKLQRLQQMPLLHGGGVENSNKDIQGSNQLEPASSFGLSRRCILVVGGLPKMEALYRRLIERNGGTFEYHDGRMNTGQGPKELVNQVRRADLILCCLDHSSHTSALVVRKLCKKYEKPYRALINSSQNNILLALSTFKGELMVQRDEKVVPFKSDGNGEDKPNPLVNQRSD